MGSLITSIVCIVSAYALWRAIRSQHNNLILFPLCLLSLAYINADLYDINAHYDVLTAFLLITLALWL